MIISSKKGIVCKFPCSIERACLVFATNRKNLGSPEIDRVFMGTKSIRAIEESSSCTDIVFVIQ